MPCEQRPQRSHFTVHCNLHRGDITIRARKSRRRKALANRAHNASTSQAYGETGQRSKSQIGTKIAQLKDEQEEPKDEVKTVAFAHLV